MPKTVLSTTAHSATSRVTWNACRACSVVRASMTGWTPSPKVRQTISPTGSTSSRNRYASATKRSVHLATTRPPALDQVERDQDQERHDEQRGRDGRRRVRVVAFDPPEDVDGRDL